jgi:NADH:ubiquinone oxidoreductase subunit F (NADH-binding)
MYELGVSNAWNGTTMFINADLPEIIAFKERLVYCRQPFQLFEDFNIDHKIFI